MIHGYGVGHEYRVALDGYMAEQERHADDVTVFQAMLRNCKREELKEWYELYKDQVVVGVTRRIKKGQSE